MVAVRSVAVVEVVKSRPEAPQYTEVVDRLAERVAKYVEARGGTASRMYAADLGTDEILRRATAADAIVIMGGDDVDPALYDGPAEYPGSGTHNRAADDAQVALVRAAAEQDIPLMGICRGLQVVNVALGGSLIPDLGERLPHRLPEDAPYGEMADHTVRFRPGSGLERAYGTAEATIKSSHHQAIDRLAEGLEVIASADDGIVEAVTATEHPILAVQWHPEARADDDIDLGALFAAANIELPGAKTR